MNEKNNNFVAPALVLGVCLAIGIILAGYFFAAGVMETRRGDRTVTVRGLAEREVTADWVAWPLTFRVTGKDLSILQDSITRNRKLIIDFLLKQGFPAAEITTRPPNTVDVEAQSYNNNQERPFRYIATTTVMLQTKDVRRVLAAMEVAGDLIQQGVVLGGEEYANARPEFQFTALNDLKPAMLQEANQNARKAAAKFGDDSASAIGAIRKANQGLFEIRDRDTNTPDQKIIRVVTQVEYFLK